MSVFFVVFGVMLLIVVAMSVGVLMGRKPISGSCGGMSALGMDVACDICKGDKAVCETEVEKAKANAKGLDDLTYDASKK
ncbi:MAG: (Na+)-NQR maturation NqrM [Pseudomonadales bacterium]|uniref:ApbE family protein n=1 Tax=Oleiphilus messinensis TaxID=141451 RepID=A0A1Y0IB95_9GAMM|nr:(Na+)-NQR maturation NqrM [Oleiphilus messinensis]ARU56663.1 hypothetical protein OLMES_2613 [Oleiphilus messinensis]MCG8610492.1 (Na+)-NQR maturation NqrM [Pseudomonadales bacterium]